MYRFDEDVLSLKPSAVVIQAGINDLVAGAILGRRDETVRNTIDNLDHFVKAAREASVEVYLMTVFRPARSPPWRAPFWPEGVAAAVAQVNDAIGAMAGEGVHVIDADAWLAGEDRVMPRRHARDTLHLNEAGYARLNELVKALGPERMLFNSWVFAAFFVIFFPVYLLVRRHIGLRNLWILLASYVFYGWWNPRFVTLLAILAAVDYLAALGVAGLPVRQFDRVKAALFTMAVTVGCAILQQRRRAVADQGGRHIRGGADGGNLAHRPGARGEAQAAVAVSFDLRQPRRAGLLQVRQLLH